MEVYRPCSTAELADMVCHAVEQGTRLDIKGGGSKSGIGAPLPETRILDMRGFAGVVAYDPGELVLTVRAGTRLAEVEALVAEQNQMLAFEPYDHGPLDGREAGRSTIGGVVAAGFSGPRRLSRGGVRDHLLGFAAVSGRGEPFVAGGKVVKNVTGYDLPKLVTGSWGRLAAVTEVTMKVLPAPRQTVTHILRGLDAQQACRAMSVALGSQAEVAAAAYLPCEADAAAETCAMTAFRLEGFAPSVAARAALLERVLVDFGQVEVAEPADRIWEEVKTLSPLANAATLWRVSIPPKSMPHLAETLAAAHSHWLADWGGGLIWTSFSGDPRILRRAAADAGGHALLVRGSSELRAAVPAFHPQQPALAALEARVRRGFDPAGIFETGRFLEQAHAN